MIRNCKKCKKEFNTYPCREKRGGGQFCSMECRKRVVKKDCSVCNKTYEVEKWRSKIKKTCSKECGRKLVKKRNENKKKSNCVTCKQEFIMSNASKGLYCSRECYWNNSYKRKGEHKCQDCGNHISKVKRVKRCFMCSSLNKIGENHPRWIMDRNRLKKHDRRGDSAYCEWRRQVWLRDNFTCKIDNPDCSGRLEAHHILRWSKFPELRYEVNNGITLCASHHPRKIKDEERLSPYFQELVYNK